MLNDIRNPAKEGLPRKLMVDALDAVSDAIQVDERSGAISFVNQAWCRLFRADRDEVIGLEWDRVLLEGAGTGGLATTWRQCLMDGRSEGALDLKGPGGHVSVAYVRTLCTVEQETGNYVLTVYRAPTFDTVSESLPMSAMLRSPSARVVHKLNNLLTTAMGNVHLLEPRLSDPGLRERLALIRVALSDGAALLRRTDDDTDGQ